MSDGGKILPFKKSSKKQGEPLSPLDAFFDAYGKTDGDPVKIKKLIESVDLVTLRAMFELLVEDFVDANSRLHLVSLATDFLITAGDENADADEIEDAIDAIEPFDGDEPS